MTITAVEHAVKRVRAFAAPAADSVAAIEL
jgi:hypothetical protein